MLNTQRVLRAAAKESLPVCVVMTKMDRLIVELRLPPEDAYFKIRHTLTEINRLLKLYGSKSRVSPSRGNVCFSSGVHMWSFTVQSMARLYAKRNPKINAEAFSKRLWGDTYVVTSYFFSAKNHSLTHSLTHIHSNTGTTTRTRERSPRKRSNIPHEPSCSSVWILCTNCTLKFLVRRV